LARESLESKNFAINDESQDRYVVSDDDIKKAFRNNLCESFKFMMKSKNWPDGLWRYALESENEQSKEKMKFLLECVKDFPKKTHLNNLLKTNNDGKTALFDKLMHHAGHESTSGHLHDSLMIFNTKHVLSQLYQRLLFFGVVKRDENCVKFAVKNGASLEEETSLTAAIAIANKYCWCSKERSQEEMENNTNDRLCLHLKLVKKTALEIATTLEKDGLEKGSDKKSFRPIKSYLEDEMKKLTGTSNTKNLPVSLDTESEDEF